MDLVHDDRPDARQHLPGATREQQEQRLRRGDQDVGALPGEQPAVLRRRISGPHRDRHLRQGQPTGVREATDAGERRAQVAFDIDGQRLERR